VQAFRLIVESTPDLDRLIRWHEGHWHWRDGLSPDEVRGIMNYVREHWTPTIEA